MKRLGVWLYRYIAMRANSMLRHVLAVLDALAPSPAYRPAYQRVRKPAAHSIDDIRLRSDFLPPLM